MEGLEIFLSINNNGDGGGNGYGDGYGKGYGDGYGSGDGSGYGSGKGSGYGYGYGDGDGYGYGSGDGNGYGDGYGDGYGSGKGSGYGNGYGYGSGDGNGYGDGYGNGDGNGDGDGNGSGSGSGILTINEGKVYKIDGVNTIIDKLIRNNLVKGRILNSDLTTTPCFVAKVGNYFAHADTVEEAFKEANEKFEDNLPIEDRIKMFVDQFKKDELYSIEEFSKAHNKLTGSCQMGRDSFIKGIESKKYTPQEFIEKTQNSYGGETIKLLIPYYEPPRTQPHMV
jgi:hypothetical protein